MFKKENRVCVCVCKQKLKQLSQLFYLLKLPQSLGKKTEKERK